MFLFILLYIMIPCLYSHWTIEKAANYKINLPDDLFGCSPPLLLTISNDSESIHIVNKVRNYINIKCYAWSRVNTGALTSPPYDKNSNSDNTGMKDNMNLLFTRYKSELNSLMNHRKLSGRIRKIILLNLMKDFQLEHFDQNMIDKMFIRIDSCDNATIIFQICNTSFISKMNSNDADMILANTEIPSYNPSESNHIISTAEKRISYQDEYASLSLELSLYIIIFILIMSLICVFCCCLMFIKCPTTHNSRYEPHSILWRYERDGILTR